MTEKVIKRGYVKWEDENGYHKEPLADHPELLKDASPKEQLAAEEARRLNEAAVEYLEAQEEEGENRYEEALEELKAAPEDVLTAAQLTEEAPAAAPEETNDEEHDAALNKLAEDTSSKE